MLDGEAYALRAPSLNTLAAAVACTAALQLMSVRTPGTALPHIADPQRESGVASCVSAAKVPAGAPRLSELEHEVGAAGQSTESAARTAPAEATAAGAAGVAGQQPMSLASLGNSQPCMGPAVADAMAGDLARPQQAGTVQAQEPVLAAGDLPLAGQAAGPGVPAADQLPAARPREPSKPAADQLPAGQATASCVPAAERERPCSVCLGILQVRMQAHGCT